MHKLKTHLLKQLAKLGMVMGKDSSLKMLQLTPYEFFLLHIEEFVANMTHRC